MYGRPHLTQFRCPQCQERPTFTMFAILRAHLWNRHQMRTIPANQFHMYFGDDIMELISTIIAQECDE